MNGAILSPVPRGGKREGSGAKPKPEGETVERKNVSLYPWEWAELQHEGEGPTEAVRRLLKERREKRD